jgi:alpha-amylase
LDASKDEVSPRIADHFVDLLSIGFSGFRSGIRIDAAKHIGPDDLAVIFAKLKSAMGGELLEDSFTCLEKSSLAARRICSFGIPIIRSRRISTDS